MGQRHPQSNTIVAIGMVIVLAIALLPIKNEKVNADSVKIQSKNSLENSNLSPETIRSAYLLVKLRQYLQSAEGNYESLEEKIEETRGKIEESRYTLNTLEEEVQQLEKMAETTEKKIRNVEEQIVEKEKEIGKSLKQLKFNKIQQEDQKDLLKDYLKLLYLEKNIYFDQNNQANVLKILLQMVTTSSILKKSTYLNLLENQAISLLKNLENLQREEQKQSEELMVKRNQFENLEKNLEGEQRNLVAQLEGKQNLLRETQGNDEIYRELFASYMATQQAILDEISSFKNNIQLLDERFSLIKSELSEEELKLIAQIQGEATGDLSIQDAAEFLKLEWPVSPEKGLTAYFDDEAYRNRFGVAHHALDIRMAHGSVIFAPADGVVFKVYDAAALEDPKAKLGYGYLMIAHRKGVMTLYGHLSGALVKEGDFVRRGQIIGLTGGTPGTPGAGVRTTGAHLHMEVIQDGVRVDPLEYLPLEKVPVESLSEKYLHILEERLTKSLEEEGVKKEWIESIEAEDQSPEEVIEESIGAVPVNEF